MTDRNLLGPADVSDEQLAAIVASSLREETAQVLDVDVDEVDYGLDAITTAGRYWVHGSARTPTGERPFRIFVKHIQSWARSPFFQYVPVELRAIAEAGVPWRTEGLIYRSDLADRLPDGLAMPRALAVVDLDERSTAVWLEAVDVRELTWDAFLLGRAAFLLGRLAGSIEVRELAEIGRHGATAQSYLDGRLRAQVLPMIESDGLWQHPLLASSFSTSLRDRLRGAASRAQAYVDELMSLPVATAHGDACTNNLLGRAGDDDLVLIDYGFWGLGSIGFDLGQLLVGDVQIGRRPAADLPWMEERCLPAYVEGLAAEGFAVDPAVVRRAHALQLMIFTGLSAFPHDHLEAAPTPELFELAADRALLTEFALDLVDAT